MTLENIRKEYLELVKTIKDEKNFFTEDGHENDNLLKLKEIYEKENTSAVNAISDGGIKLFGNKTKSGSESELNREQV